MTTLRKALWLACMIAAAGLNEKTSLGQNTQPMTLHVYVNTIQIPVLVLGKNRQPVEPVAANRFLVNFDSGPWFPATHARLEADDPISLAILLDVSGNSATLMRKVSDEIADLAPNGLHHRDHVSVYSLDCGLFQTADNLPAGAATLKQAVDNALAAVRSRTSIKHHAGCRQKIHLWDALAYVTNQLRELPGRRVILVLTDGNDQGSKNSWNELRLFAQESAVAVFAVRSAAAPPQMLAGVRDSGLARNQPALPQGWAFEDDLTAVCELSGGMVFTANEHSLAKTLQRFPSILRQRYIVEFPRPYNGTAGPHDMEVKVEKGADYFIRPTGNSVPIADPALARDPTTLPSDPSHEPEQGTRKILTPN